MPFQIIRDDITKVKADVIVNTANPKPVIGSSTDSAVYGAAGEEKLLAELADAGVTTSFRLSLMISGITTAGTTRYCVLGQKLAKKQASFCPIVLLDHMDCKKRKKDWEK